MKKIFFLASALAVLASCSNNDELPASASAPEQEPLVIDLNALNYGEVMTRLSESSSLKDVTFVDGDVVKTVAELIASDYTDPMQSGALTFSSVNAGDSIDLTVSEDYLAVRSTVKGEQLAYVAYADADYQAKLSDFYSQLAPATRGGAPIVTRGTAGSSMKLNLTGMHEQMEANLEAMTATQPPVLPEGVATRGWFSNLWNKIVAVFKPAPAPPVVRKATIDIYLMREKGANPVTHEMNWQVNDAINSLKEVYGDVNFNVYIRDCDFKGNNSADNTINNFRNWVQNTSYRNTNGIFILCRWGGWDYLGMAELGSYNVNNDWKAFGISATNAWNKFTMAHEMGHIFGAEHVSTSWWQVFWSADLMSATSYDWLNSGKHKDNANRDRIKARLKLN